MSRPAINYTISLRLWNLILAKWQLQEVSYFYGAVPVTDSISAAFACGDGVFDAARTFAGSRQTQMPRVIQKTSNQKPSSSELKY